MDEKCKSGEGVCQGWPKSSKLKENLDTTMNNLKGRLRGERGDVYAYVLTTVERNSGGFVQTGSAPNFQGGLITLCTCKHFMRSWRSYDAWKGVWIAGFTGINTVESGGNYLFYLMRVRHAFQSHNDLWAWLDTPTRAAKNATHYRCGDVYEPTPALKNPFKVSGYHKPCSNHIHWKNDDWHKDINYLNTNGKRRPALLVGDPDHSFLWSQPKIYFRDKLPRTKKLDHIEDLIQLLVSA